MKKRLYYVAVFDTISGKVQYLIITEDALFGDAFYGRYVGFCHRIY